MLSASISVAKNQLSALIRRVQGGEAVLITDRGMPVAQLVPVGRGPGVPASVLGLAQQGLAVLPPAAPTAEWLDLPLPKPSPGASAVEVLLKERRAGR